MAIITQSLLNFPVPVIRQELTGKDLAFYALSVGAGQDVMDPNELMLVDANKGRCRCHRQSSSYVIPASGLPILPPASMC